MSTYSTTAASNLAEDNCLLTPETEYLNKHGWRDRFRRSLSFFYVFALLGALALFAASPAHAIPECVGGSCVPSGLTCTVDEDCYPPGTVFDTCEPAVNDVCEDSDTNLCDSGFCEVGGGACISDSDCGFCTESLMACNAGGTTCAGNTGGICSITKEFCTTDDDCFPDSAVFDGCINDTYNFYNGTQSLNCTANDIRISETSVLVVIDACEFLGDFATVQLEADFLLSATARHDVGVYIGVDGGFAVTGECLAQIIPELDDPSSGIAGDPADLDSFCTNSDVCAEDGVTPCTNPGGNDFVNCGPIDTCGDIQDVAPFNGSINDVPLAPVTLPCLDNNGDGQADLPSCLSWRQPGANDICNGPLDAFPGTPSKCRCEILDIPLAVPKSLEVVKEVIPSDDTGKFNLEVRQDVGGSPLFYQEPNVMDGGSTGRLDVSDGFCSGDGTTPCTQLADCQVGEIDNGICQPTDRLVGETGGNSTSLGSYTTDIACVDRIGMCSGNPEIICSLDGSVPDPCPILGAGTCTGDPVPAESCTTCTQLPVEITEMQTDILCTVTNTRKPRINVIKDIVPDSDTGKFNLRIDGVVRKANAGDGDQTGFKPVNVGVHSVSETAGNGTNLANYDSSISCDNGDSGSGTSLGGITLGIAEDVTCTITNTRRGKIIIEKQTLPDGDPQSFSFAGDVGGSLSDGQTAEMDVSPGTYTSTETVPSGWDLTDISCDDGNSSGNTGTATATFNVEAGETVKCTFTNTKRGNIQVAKETLPDGDPQSFAFAGDVVANLTDGQSSSLVEVTPGTYTSTETVPALWVNTDISCDDGNSTGNTGTATATFNVEPGETVKCTFTNTKGGTIIIEKQTLPDGDPQSFSFAGDVSGSLSDGQTASQNVVPGAYSSTETVPAGWDLTNISCDDGNSSGNIGTGVASFNVEPGETVKCTFTNTKRGKIIIEKQTLPDGDPQSFSFAGDVGGSLSDGQTAMQEVVPGNYSSTETVPAGWDLTDISCDDGDSTGNTGTGVASFVVAPGEEVKCTFTNTKRGKIIVVKQTLPDGDPQTFDFAGDVAGTLGDGDMAMTEVAPGAYSSTETVPAGWDLTSINCDDGNSSGNTGTGVASFNVEPGEIVTCTFTNTKRGKIIIEKQTLPDGDPQSFSFAGDVGGSLSDGQTAMQEVAPGAYSSTETVPSGWDLTNISCDDGNSSGNTGTGVASFNVEPGEEVKCTFTNTKRGKIIIEKQTLPDGDPQSFSFAGDVGGSLSDGQTAMQEVVPGNYSSTETVPAGWDLTDISCDDGDSSGNTGTGVASFVVAPGEEVKCTFTNTKRGKIIIEKQTLPDGEPGNFDFAGDVGGTLADGDTAMQEVVPGNYSSTETVPSGWELTDISCDDGDSTGNIGTATASFVVAPGEEVKCTFTNGKIPLIRVIKSLSPSDDPGTFDLQIDAVTQAAGVGDGGDTGFVEVSVGDHSVGELGAGGTNLADYDSDVSCDNGDSADPGTSLGGISVTYGDEVTCTITNRALHMVDLVKTFNGVPSDIVDQPFVVYDGPDGFGGTQVASDTTLGAVDGLLTFGGVKLYADQTYTICEEGIPAGTTANWFIDVNDDGFIDVGDLDLVAGGYIYNPDDPLDVGNRCLDFGAGTDFEFDAGDTFGLLVDNTTPGGDARTPGYWQAWSSCTNGNQFDKAMQEYMDGVDPRHFTTDELLPKTIGILVIAGDSTGSPYDGSNDADCETAVKVLKSRHQTKTGKGKNPKPLNMANDPSYKVARSLLAYKLNQMAGAGTCPVAQQAESDADALLVSLNWDGTKTYLGGKGKNKAGTPEDIALANTLNGILDAYNNNELCP